MKGGRDGLLVIYMQGLGCAKPLVIGVLYGYWAVATTCAASCTEILVHVPGPPSNMGGKIA